MYSVCWVAFFFLIPMAFIQIEQLTKLFLYFSINIQLQSCYTYIPTIQQVVHSCYGCQKSSMHNCYTSVIMAMMIILKPPELIHTVTAPKTCSIQCSIFLSFIYKLMIITALMGKEKKKLHVNKWLEITTIWNRQYSVPLFSSGKMVINISGSCLLFKLGKCNSFQVLTWSRNFECPKIQIDLYISINFTHIIWVF